MLIFGTSYIKLTVTAYVYTKKLITPFKQSYDVLFLSLLIIMKTCLNSARDLSFYAFLRASSIICYPCQSHPRPLNDDLLYLSLQLLYNKASLFKKFSLSFFDWQSSGSNWTSNYLSREDSEVCSCWQDKINHVQKDYVKDFKLETVIKPNEQGVIYIRTT